MAPSSAGARAGTTGSAGFGPDCESRYFARSNVTMLRVMPLSAQF